MSVLITLLIKGDPTALEKHAADDPDAIGAIAEVAKEHGLIAHRFYGSDDGQILVVDEWPDAESFQRFFSSTQEQIGPLMAALGATAEPVVTFWRELDSRDKVGWGA